MSVKFKSGVITITRSQLDKIRQDITLDAYNKAIAELQKREQEVINTVSDDSFRMMMVTSTNALFKMGCDYEFVSEFTDFAADLVCLVNEERMTLEELEKENAELGLKLVKIQGSDMPKELLIKETGAEIPKEMLKGE